MELITKHKDVKHGDFVKVAQISGPVTDRLNFTGQVVQSTKRFIEIRTFDGVAGISLEDDTYGLEVSKLKRKPAGWDKFMKNPEKFREKAHEVAPAVNKRSIVYKIVKNNPRKKFDSLLKQAHEEIGGDRGILKQYVEMGILKFRGA